MKLSVIIPTLGRKNELTITFKNLCNQKLIRSYWECLIIAQSDVNIEEIKNISKQQGINTKIFFIKTANASLARNIGIIEARGDIILFIDDDIEIKSNNFFEQHLSNYKNKTIPGVAGQIIDITKAVREYRHIWSFNQRFGWLYFPFNYNKNTYILNGCSCNLSVRKEYALTIGGMDINFEKGAHREESDFCLRLTKRYGKLLFDHKATVIHLNTNSGGCRTWGINAGIHPLHHVKGEWYFILNGLKNKTICVSDLIHHIGALIFRQILNKENIINPWNLFRAIIQSLYGFICTTSLIFKNSKTLKNIKINNYEIIYNSNQ